MNITKDYNAKWDKSDKQGKYCIVITYRLKKNKFNLNSETENRKVNVGGWELGEIKRDC